MYPLTVNDPRVIYTHIDYLPVLVLLSINDVKDVITLQDVTFKRDSDPLTKKRNKLSVSV